VPEYLIPLVALLLVVLKEGEGVTYDGPYLPSELFLDMLSLFFAFNISLDALNS
jgi:hypothetical protein